MTWELLSTIDCHWNWEKHEEPGFLMVPAASSPVEFLNASGLIRGMQPIIGWADDQGSVRANGRTQQSAALWRIADLSDPPL
jgi:hypothetical protein